MKIMLNKIIRDAKSYTYMVMMIALFCSFFIGEGKDILIISVLLLLFCLVILFGVFSRLKFSLKGTNAGKFLICFFVIKETYLFVDITNMVGVLLIILYLLLIFMSFYGNEKVKWTW